MNDDSLVVCLFTTPHNSDCLTDLELFNPRMDGPLGRRVTLPVHHIVLHRQNVSLYEALHSPMQLLTTWRHLAHAHCQRGDVTRPPWRHRAGGGACQLPANVSEQLGCRSSALSCPRTRLTCVQTLH